MSQTSQPISDLVTGQWTPLPVYQQINDPYPGDGTFVSSFGLVDGDTFQVRLGACSTPKPGTQTLSVRLRQDGVGPLEAWVSLVQQSPTASTVVVASRRAELNAVFTDFNIVLSNEEIGRITNYSWLGLRVTAIRTSSSSSSGSRTSTGSSSASGSGSTSGGSQSGGSTSTGSNGSISGGSISASSGSFSASYSSSSSFSSFSGSSTNSSVSNSASSFSSSFSGSNSSSGSRVQTACCPNSLPTTLYVTWSGVLQPLGTVQLNSQPIEGPFGFAWVGYSNTECGAFEFTFVCFAPFAADKFLLYKFIQGTETPLCEEDASYPVSCDPFLFESACYVDHGNCQGDTGYTITETPP